MSVLAGGAACAVRSLELDVKDLERSTDFYTNVWALEIVGEIAGARYLRAAGPESHVLVLRAAAKPALHAVEIVFPARTDIDARHAQLAKAGIVAGTPHVLDRPSGGYGFSFRDGFGRQWLCTAEVAPHAEWAHDPDRPFKVSHVVINSPNAAADAAFAREHFGFRLRDETKGMIFLGCNADHHSLAFAHGQNLDLNHVAFDVDSIDAVMRGGGRLKRLGHPMQWGVGRHGPGANVYSYYLDPDDFPIEYTAEILQVDDAVYKPGSPADWDRPPFWDAWGISEPPTQRFREASAGHRN